MKFGKTYMETLASPSFPKEWREGAIEYKHVSESRTTCEARAIVSSSADDAINIQLKKLINGVVAELESLGLGADVLKDLIEPPAEHAGAEETRPKSVTPPGTPSEESTSEADCEECEKGQKESPASEWIASIAHAQHDHSHTTGRRPSGTQRRSSNESQGHLKPSTSSSGNSSDRGREVGPDGVEVMRSTTSPSRGLGKKDLEEMRASGLGRKDKTESKRQQQQPRPSSVSPSTSDDDRDHDWGGHAWRERPGTKSSPAKPRVGGGWVNGKDGRRARAEYELGGTEEHPIPRIRLFVESPVNSDDEDDDGNDDDGLDEVSKENGQDLSSDFSASAHITELPESPRSFTTIKQSPPLVGVPLSPSLIPTRLDDEEDVVDKKMRSREIVIPLTADTEFLDTLTGALANLTSLQSTQKHDFVEGTENLCNSVARVASPYASKNDMYVWREIFSLWVEMQIFESEREKDRGELSVDESEARLKRFAEELAKRGWTAESAPSLEETKKGGHMKLSKRNVVTTSNLPMKDPRSIKALEDFLRLNLVLLDVKKFQRVNVEAARKILKKHDKRTALTASSDLAHFMARQEQARALLSNVSDHHAAALTSTTHPSLAALLPTSTTALLSQSLPHILLSLLSTTLLPILPSIDDYSCAICTGVAWRPIRLDCTHLFCIRCLVKLQKKNKVDCPLCRAKGVVGSADGRNMDQATINFLKAWFPKEVAEKDGENETERRKEEMQELGLSLESEKCAIM